MGYKELGKKISFADLAVSKSLEHNRSLTETFEFFIRCLNFSSLNNFYHELPHAWQSYLEFFSSIKPTSMSNLCLY